MIEKLISFAPKPCDGATNHCIWLQSGKNTFKAQMVTLDEERGDIVAILSSLMENDKVVVLGAYLFYSEFVLKKGAAPMADHQH